MKYYLIIKMHLLTIKLLILTSIFCQIDCFSISNFPGQIDQVTILPQFNSTLSVRHYAGYLKSVNDTNLFYWYFESQSQPDKDPLVLWLNGGPGASSLIGALLETGPLQMQANGTLTLNAYSWNSDANLLFIETPIGVGFSYQANVSADYDYPTDDNKTALINFEALRSFYQKFPHLTTNDFYLAGQSYAGIYQPMLAMHLLAHQFPPNFKGVALGNPGLDQRYRTHSTIQYAFQQNIIFDFIWYSLLDICNCSLSNQTIRDCAFFNYTTVTMKDFEAFECKLAYLQAFAIMLDKKRNVYNYNLFCANQSEDYLCTNARDAALKVWFNLAEVQEALHVATRDRNSTLWSGINRTVWRNYNQNILSVRSHIERLLEKNVKVLLYFGDLDLAATTLGGEWFINDLNVTAVNTNATDWFFDSQLVAELTVYQEGLAYVKIKNAGHFVPKEKPAFAKHMFKRFLSASLFNLTIN